MITDKTKKGIKKWSLKNRLKVGPLTANPPQSHLTMSAPKKGIAEKRLVITVAPQNDICPHGRTYPKNAVAIDNSKMVTPDIHV